eukprot:2458251-Prymnesium_polylepis.1
MGKPAGSLPQSLSLPGPAPLAPTVSGAEAPVTDHVPLVPTRFGVSQDFTFCVGKFYASNFTVRSENFSPFPYARRCARALCTLTHRL